MFKFDYDTILPDIQEKLEQVAVKISEEIQLYLTDERRNFPRTTIRKEGRGITGKIANSPRDVVDTGELADSFSVKVERYEDYLSIVTTAWDAPHAVNVYFGHGNVPPYPWIDIALRRLDINKIIGEVFNG